MVDLHPKYGFIVTVGGGPFMDVVKEYDPDKTCKDLMATNSLENNCLYLESLLSGSGEIISPQNFDKINDNYLENKIAIVYRVLENTPLSDSDTHAIAAAELLKIDKVYFLKNTPGIFKKDPNTKSEEPNDFIRRATIDDFLSGKISREGTDRCNEHLIETSALEYYRHVKYLHEIRILDANNAENIEYALRNVNVGSVIAKE